MNSSILPARPVFAEAQRRGAKRLTILADPNATGFYENNGAVRIGEAPSEAVHGRLLPLYEVRLDLTGIWVQNGSQREIPWSSRKLP